MQVKNSGEGPNSKNGEFGVENEEELDEL